MQHIESLSRVGLLHFCFIVFLFSGFPSCMEINNLLRDPFVSGSFYCSDKYVDMFSTEIYIVIEKFFSLLIHLLICIQLMDKSYKILTYLIPEAKEILH